ncbi:hypothetical protein ACIN8IBEIGE_50184 [Acinetobacter sp. 8I-beige]|nr:hypothetical protein ACIN8IBEIGE_50184 [Acinetobacter sp. 8I-beige]
MIKPKLDELNLKKASSNALNAY